MLEILPRDCLVGSCLPPAQWWFSPGQMLQHQLQQVLGRTLKAHLPSPRSLEQGLSLHSAVCRLGDAQGVPWVAGCPARLCHPVSPAGIPLCPSRALLLGRSRRDPCLPARASQSCFCQGEQQHRAGCQCLLWRQKTGAALDSSADFHKPAGVKTGADSEAQGHAGLTQPLGSSREREPRAPALSLATLWFTPHARCV